LRWRRRRPQCSVRAAAAAKIPSAAKASRSSPRWAIFAAPRSHLEATPEKCTDIKNVQKDEEKGDEDAILASRFAGSFSASAFVLVVFLLLLLLLLKNNNFVALFSCSRLSL
jgi:hypothetical protein